MIILALHQLGCRPDQYVRLRKLIQLGVMNTVRSLSSEQTLSAQPVPGSLWLARHGNLDKGHAGIVIKAGGNGLMTTIESNTSAAFQDAESDRQGDGIFRRERNVVSNGSLNAMGFLTPLHAAPAGRITSYPSVPSMAEKPKSEAFAALLLSKTQEAIFRDLLLVCETAAIDGASLADIAAAVESEEASLGAHLIRPGPKTPEHARPPHFPADRSRTSHTRISMLNDIIFNIF